MPHAVAIHGGAGLIRRDRVPPEREAAARASLGGIVARADARLAAGASALDVVVEACVALEEEPLFNAGRGAVLTRAGTAELDAAVMDGRDRRAGAVTLVRRVRNPVLLARAVMEHTPHVFLGGEGAEALAEAQGLECVSPAWFLVPERVAQLERARERGGVSLDHGSSQGTVGAVACDGHGHVAAATSTGGMVHQWPGRVGDTPIIGAGTFAWDRTCAVSATGHGEAFVRLGVAGRVSARMELAGESLAEAARAVLAELGPLGAEGGLIAVDAHGTVVLPFVSAGMYRASQVAGGAPHVAIWPTDET